MGPTLHLNPNYPQKPGRGKNSLQQHTFGGALRAHLLLLQRRTPGAKTFAQTEEAALGSGLYV